MAWNPEIHGTFGDYMRGGQPLGKGRTADVIVGDRTWATRDQVTEGRRGDGTRFKHVTDQLGHETTDRTDPRGKVHRDVTINLSS